MSDCRVLSIQSHVVRGYVGNKSAVFPLQLHGIEVDIINSVHFSNHTGYPTFTGQRLTGVDVLNLIDGLEANKLIHNAYTHLLTGYIGSPELLRAIVTVYERLKKAQPHAFQYVCDPVLGDNGKLYVATEIVNLYRSLVVPIANILTPNQFECELLTEETLETIQDAMAACILLHERGPSVVVITSFQEAENTKKDKEVVVIGSKRSKDCPQVKYEQWELRVPWIDSYYTGTGDLFAALLLVWLQRSPHDFSHALMQVLATIQAVLNITLTQGGRNCELKLIQSKHVIEHPPSFTGICKRLDS